MINVRTGLGAAIAIAFSWAAMSSGTLASDAKEKQAVSLSQWIDFTQDAVRSSIDYPENARDLAHEGAPELLITIDRTGRLITVSLDQTSGHSDLDCAADTLIQDLKFPQLPKGFSGDKLTFRMAINYDLISVND